MSPEAPQRTIRGPELAKTPESTPHGRIGILPHGYWRGDVMRKGRSEAVLGLRSHLVAKAASLKLGELAAAQGEENTPEISFSLAYMREPGLMLDAIKKYGVATSNIIDEGEIYSTWGEIKMALQIAEKRGWARLIDIAFMPHFESIKMLFKKIKPRIPVEFISAEEILRKRDVHRFSRDYIKRIIDENGNVTEEPIHIQHEHNHTAHLLNRLERSRYDWSFRNVYEKLVKRPLLRLGYRP